MGAIVDSLVSDPLWYIGFLLATLAALAFLVFLRGFLSGVPHFFTLSSHDEHIHHHRVRVTWGFFLLLFLFILWQVIRWLADLLTF